MKKNDNSPQAISSISQWSSFFSLPKPQHPLISLLRHSDTKNISANKLEAITFDFYLISIKKDFKGKMRYGKNYYDFDEGTMTFISPGQVIAIDSDDDRDCSGWSLMFHIDFIRNYPLGKKIKEYSFFSYAVNEALHLSDKEEKMMENIIDNIEQEYNSSIDHYSQDVMVSHLELLLNYSNRFYNRQFITRKVASNDILVQLDDLLTDYYNSKKALELGLPTVHYLSENLNLSSNYLSDMLRNLTGQTTQQHIHNKIIEKAKETLTATDLSVSEIAYQLGFEQPQSFNKLFKNKTNMTPLEFKQSFNEN
jgi:AraC family transcriptional regulator, transcriptional activator of pobA